MKIYHLNTSNTICFITGFEICNDFLTIMRLQDMETGKYLQLNRVLLMNLLTELKYIFNVNIEYPDPYSYSFNKSIMVSKVCSDKFKIELFDKEYIIIDEASLLRLYNLSKIIINIIDLLDLKRFYYRRGMSMLIDYCINNNATSQDECINLILNTEFESISDEIKFDLVINCSDHISRSINKKM